MTFTDAMRSKARLSITGPTSENGCVPVAYLHPGLPMSLSMTDPSWLRPDPVPYRQATHICFYPAPIEEWKCVLFSPLASYSFQSLVVLRFTIPFLQASVAGIVLGLPTRDKLKKTDGLVKASFVSMAETITIKHSWRILSQTSYTDSRMFWISSVSEEISNSALTCSVHNNKKDCGVVMYAFMQRHNEQKRTHLLPPIMKNK